MQTINNIRFPYARAGRMCGRQTRKRGADHVIHCLLPCSAKQPLNPGRRTPEGLLSQARRCHHGTRRTARADEPRRCGSEGHGVQPWSGPLRVRPLLLGRSGRSAARVILSPTRRASPAARSWHILYYNALNLIYLY